MNTIDSFADLSLILEALKKGGLVVFPCETVYGVAVDSENPEAVEKLNKLSYRRNKID